MSPEQSRLDRRLNTPGAVVLGVGSMVGAGVFVVWAPAAGIAGTWLLAGLAVALGAAVCNATSSAQLAAVYPSAGGTYVYGRERLGAWWGFAAGWSFLLGKTASCGAMALAAASHLVPDAARPVAALLLAAMVGVNVLGVHRTVAATGVLLALSLTGIGVALAAGLSAEPQVDEVVLGAATGPAGPGWYAVLQSGGLLFFAFAGYARLATLGEEVREPRTTIPRAVVLALGIAGALYVVLALVLLRGLGVDALTASSTPVTDLTDTVGWVWARPVVTTAAVAAALGALLALLAGVGRTAFAMGRAGDLPRMLARVAPRSRTPWVAEVVVGAVAVALVLTVDLREVIGFSSFGVLLYYAITNVAALTQPAAVRLYPRWSAVLGVVLCLLLAATLPAGSVLSGLMVLAVGLAGRAVTSLVGRGSITG